MAEPEVFDKLISTHEAVAKLIPDGARLRLCGIALRKPMNFVYELVRQRRKDLILLLSGWTEDADILVGAGCIEKLEGSYFGLEALGLANNYRRAVEKGIPRKVRIEEYSNFAMTMRFMAAAMGLPFMPVRSLLGSDLLKVESFMHPKAVVIDDPFEGQKVALVPACKSDVAVLHCQRVDREGNAQVWGQTGDDIWGTLSAKSIIVSAEEIVESAVVRKDPNRTIVPAFRVDAIVHQPWGGHPYQVQGYYDADLAFRLMYQEKCRTREGFLEFLDEWVLGFEDHDAYVEGLGRERLEKLKAKPRWSDPVNYGY